MPTRFELHGVALSGPTCKVGSMLHLAGEPFDYVHVPLKAWMKRFEALPGFQSPHGMFPFQSRAAA